LNSTATERVLIVLTDSLTATRSLLPTARRTPAARFLDRDMDFAIVHSFAGKLIHYSRKAVQFKFSPASAPSSVGQPSPARVAAARRPWMRLRFAGPKLRYPSFPIATAVSAMRLEKPHSLSYQA